MLISLAVRDYAKMFPDEYKKVLDTIKWQKQNLKTDLAEIEDTHGLQRALYTVPENLHQMIVEKLPNEELNQFKDKDSARWFTKTFPQFAITRTI